MGRDRVSVSQRDGNKGGADELDGRRRRSAQSREAIVTAMFELIGEGNLRPSAQRVADRAGVGIRTVFRHFDEMDRLYAEMHARLQELIGPLLADAEPSGPLSRRARELVAARCEIYERVGPYKRSANMHLMSSPFLQKRHRSMNRALRVDLGRWLPELEQAPERVSNAVDAMLSFQTWDRLRSDQKLTQKDAREALEAALDAIVSTSLKSRA